VPTFRGTIVAFDDSTYRAAVRLDGSAPQVFTDVHVSRLAAASIVAGRRCIIDTGDHADIEDAVVIAVWAEGADDGAGFVPNVFYAYDGTGGQSLSVSAVTVNLDTEVESGDRYALASDVVTFQADGFYRVTANAVIDITNTSGGSDSEVRVWLEEDTGSGFAAIPDAFATQHEFEINAGGCSLSIALMRSFANGDQLRFRAQRANGTTNIDLEQYGARLLIEHIQD
jgi:hypothetical protein